MMAMYTLTPAEYFVHYTVSAMKMGQPEPMHCVAGPYDTDDVLAQRRDISTYSGIANVFVSDTRERPKEN